MASRRSNRTRTIRALARERDRFQLRAHFLRRDLDAERVRSHRLAEIAVSQEAELALRVHQQAGAL